MSQSIWNASVLALLVGALVLGSAETRRSVASVGEQRAPEADVVVDVSQVSVGDRHRLAAALPGLEEAIIGGTESITIGVRQYEDLRAQGFDVNLVAFSQAAEGWPECYTTLNDLYEWMMAYGEAHPDLVEITTIGQSFCRQRGGCLTPGGDLIEGRDILVARITNQAATSPKQGRLWIDGGLHARELPTVEVVKAFITHLVEGYGEDPQITYLLDHRELYAGIMSNPDGRLLVEMGTQPPYNGQPWMWRKNAHGLADTCEWPPTGSNHHGVDLNRNHVFKWGLAGSSGNACSQIFRGLSPASEPEAQAYEAFVRSVLPDQRGPGDADPAPPDATGLVINIHNYTSPGSVFVPWGWTGDVLPANNDDLWAIARRYASTNGYRADSPSSVSGLIRDWGYGELGVPSYTVELQGRRFITSCDELAEVIQANLTPLLMMLNLSDRPYMRVNGPEPVMVQAPAVVAQGETITVRAQLSEVLAGGQAIASAEALIGRPGGSIADAYYPDPSQSPGQGLAMTPADGVFDSLVEDAVLDLDTSGLAPGRYTIVVRGQDADGHWGVPAAIFIRLEPGQGPK